MDTENQKGEKNSRPRVLSPKTLTVEEAIEKLQALDNVPAGVFAGVAVWSWGKHWQAAILDRDGKSVKGVGLLDEWRDSPGEAVHAIVQQAMGYARREWRRF